MKKIRVDWSKGNVARQGDVAIINNAPKRTKKHAEIKRDSGGVVLAYGEVTGHKHQFREKHVCMLVAEGVSDRIVTVGITPEMLLERAGAPIAKPAVLRHEEHTHLELPPGDYSVRVQREFEGESSRLVED